MTIPVASTTVEPINVETTCPECAKAVNVSAPADLKVPQAYFFVGACESCKTQIVITVRAIKVQAVKA